jgi:bifunctional DNA-binding transcriptional regulator/antitoxin component of YhaV-PrlF toxin-antitoxin module
MTVTEKGQVTIPLAIPKPRIRPASEVEFALEGDHAVLAQERASRSCCGKSGAV